MPNSISSTIFLLRLFYSPVRSEIEGNWALRSVLVDESGDRDTRKEMNYVADATFREYASHHLLFYSERMWNRHTHAAAKKIWMNGRRADELEIRETRNKKRNRFLFLSIGHAQSRFTCHLLWPELSGLRHRDEIDSDKTSKQRGRRKKKKKKRNHNHKNHPITTCLITSTANPCRHRDGNM